MPHPRAVADAAERLRDRTVRTLDGLSPEELDRLALPAREPGGEDWTVADVLRHLAESDRRSVLGVHLVHLLPSTDEREFEDHNDRMLERLRGAPRQQLRDELEAWGRRLRRLIALTPRPLAGAEVPTLFGRVPVWWVATLRVYDEWVHQGDIARVVDVQPPDMDATTRGVLAPFQLRALPAGRLRRIDRREGVVEVAFEDVLSQPAWRFDLARHRYGPRVTASPTVRVVTDVPTWTCIAADRTSWQDAEGAGDLRIEGDDRAAARALLEVVRLV